MFASIFEFVMAIFENADILEIVNMIFDIIGPLIGSIFQ